MRHLRGRCYSVTRYHTHEGILNKKPSSTLRGTVEKVIKSRFHNEPEKAQIVLEGADHLYRFRSASGPGCIVLGRPPRLGAI